MPGGDELAYEKDDPTGVVTLEDHSLYIVYGGEDWIVDHAGTSMRHLGCPKRSSSDCQRIHRLTCTAEERFTHPHNRHLGLGSVGLERISRYMAPSGPSECLLSFHHIKRHVLVQSWPSPSIPGPA
jgi:hypothetical protein